MSKYNSYGRPRTKWTHNVRSRRPEMWTGPQERVGNTNQPEDPRDKRGCDGRDQKERYEHTRSPPGFHASRRPSGVGKEHFPSFLYLLRVTQPSGPAGPLTARLGLGKSVRVRSVSCLRRRRGVRGGDIDAEAASGICVRTLANREARRRRPANGPVRRVAARGDEEARARRHLLQGACIRPSLCRSTARPRDRSRCRLRSRTCVRKMRTSRKVGARVAPPWHARELIEALPISAAVSGGLSTLEHG